jgi:hypothetical protein
MSIEILLPNDGQSELDQIADQFGRLKVSTAVNLLSMGQLLAGAKDLLPFGSFQQWARDRLDVQPRFAQQLLGMASVAAQYGDDLAVSLGVSRCQVLLTKKSDQNQIDTFVASMKKPGSVPPTLATMRSLLRRLQPPLDEVEKEQPGAGNIDQLLECLDQLPSSSQHQLGNFLLSASHHAVKELGSALIAR